jgi:hypothetical protein
MIGKKVACAIKNRQRFHAVREASSVGFRRWSPRMGPKPAGPEFPVDCRPKHKRAKVTLPTVSIQRDDP